MAQLPSAFNSNDHGEMNDYSPIPEGEYLVQIEKSEMKDTKDPNNNHQYLNLQFKVIDGKFKGRMLFTILNLINSNPSAVEIAQNELATICRAAGKVAIEDSQEIHGIPMIVKVKLVPATASSPSKNKIANYKKFEGTIQPALDSPNSNSAVVQTGEVESRPPWE